LQRFIAKAFLFLQICILGQDINLKKQLLYIFILTAACYQLQAQSINYRFINFGPKDGLADKFIYSAAQDKQGYMWFGTGTGLYRYDGVAFKSFRSSADKSGHTISNVLQAVFADKTGNIWLGSLNDLQWYDPAKNKFWRPAEKSEVVKKLIPAYISNFYQNVSGDVWISTSKDYFFCFQSKDSSFVHYKNIFPASASAATIKILERDNKLFAVHSEGLYGFSSPDQQAVFYSLPFADDAIANATVSSEGILISTYTHGVYVFNPQTKQFTASRYNNEKLKAANIFCAVEKNGQLWAGSYPLFRVDGDKTTMIFENKRQNEFELSANKTGNLFFDRENNLWICSYNGLSMMPWQNQQIQQVALKDLSTSNAIEPTGVYEIFETSDLLISNTSSIGLGYYDAASKTFSIIPNPVEKNKDNKRIISVIQTVGGDMYASDDKNFFRVDIKAKKLLPFPLKDQNDKPIINAGRNVADNNGNIYIGSANNGFYTWNTQNNSLIHYDKTIADDSADIKTDNSLYPCFTDSKQDIWFTSATGVYRFNVAQKKWGHYAGKENSSVPPMSATNFIAEDKQGHYWVTTINNGLYELYFDGGKEILNNYNKNSGVGLPSDYCIKIKPDKKENILWLTSINGLHRFDPVNKKILSTISFQNGLSADGGGYSFNITNDNTLAILFYGNMDLIDLNSYRFNKTAPEIVFNSVKVFDRECVGLLENNSSLRLSNKENFLQFEFAAPSFNNSNQNQYAYQLTGADKDWIYSGNRNSVTYSGLKSGSYTFRVKAANNDGAWGKERIIKIFIKPPFYATWWFIAAAILFFSVIIFGWNRYRIKQTRKEEKLKASFQQQIAETEMKALRAQMNPHFIFNSLNSIQKYILKNEHFEASQYLTKFSRLIRLILDHSNQNSILLSSELELLKLYVEMESLRFDNKFDYKIITGENLLPDTVEIPSMLIQPYVENAIWHGLLHKESRGVLTITFERYDENKLTVTIVDDGIGREKAAELKSKQVLKKKSYGMQITEDRIAIINRIQNINATSEIIDLKDRNGNAAGTKVLLVIPLKPLTI
jgi:ligand-binding sensor domain-containing protein/two-component sensor histidine kinase